MKKSLFAFVIISALFASCGTKDNKNEAEHYPTYDTTEKMQNINSGDTTNNSPGTGSGGGENH